MGAYETLEGDAGGSFPMLTMCGLMHSECSMEDAQGDYINMGSRKQSKPFQSLQW
jgi:hypothetical protein